MAIKSSTGLRNKVLDTGPLRTVLANGFIKIYSGTVPATADEAISGANTLLTTISVGGAGTGLTFATTAASGTIVKNAAETWQGTNAASGVATFYRHVTASDTGASSTSEARIQGTIGLAGTDMVLSSTTLAAGAVQTIDYYAINLPLTA